MNKKPRSYNDFDGEEQETDGNENLLPSNLMSLSKEKSQVVGISMNNNLEEKDNFSFGSESKNA
jgi:hypothetical protein